MKWVHCIATYLFTITNKIAFFRQVEEASEIESIAKQASQTANDAYEMAYAAMEQQPTTGNQINILADQVQKMGENLRTVQSLATQTLQDASEAYNAAIKIYQEAKIMEVPKIDEGNIDKQANRVQQEAERIREEAERLIQENSMLLQDTQNRRVELEDLLNTAEDQQQQLDGQIAEMDSNRDKALKAVANGNAILEDADRTLVTLNGTYIAKPFVITH